MGVSLASIKQFIVGILVGIASMLPGVSGAVVAVCFGVYERLIADLADISHKLRSDLPFILILGFGILAGMMAIAFGLKYASDNYETLLMFFFVGLIAGQIPQLYNLTSAPEPLNITNVLAFIIGLVIMGSFLFIGTGSDQTLSHDLATVVYMLIIGIILAVSKIAPGISGSTILLVLGLYYPLIDVMTSLDLALLIPVGIGLIIGILGFSKVMNYVLNCHRRSTYLMILGLTVGSLFVVISLATNDLYTMMDVITGIIVTMIGVIVSLAFVKLGEHNSCTLPV
ncbi:MAG: DUF368 domain-containing protein [Candidatus Methanomethylophilaceae archaeon]|nr:DUF368 domain-containing protein [Candidatus Methanomethylophilaceae archaeon]